MSQEIQEVDYCSDKKYFVFDTEKFKSDLSDRGMFSYIEDRIITGYKLYLNKNSLDKVILLEVSLFLLIHTSPN